MANIGRGIFSRHSLLEQLNNISAPSMVMVGREDLPRPPREAQEMARLLNAEYHEIENAGHIANLEQPAQVNSFLESFFTRIVKMYSSRITVLNQSGK